jgi:CHAT domain-containing protein
LGDVALRQGKFKDATKFYNEAKKGAQDDKRLDLMWPAQRGLGRSLWLQAAQEKDPKKALSLRESALTNYRESLATIETLRQGSLRADESRTTFLASIKDVFDEAASAYASLALMTHPEASTPLSGKALEYASEAFRVNEQSRARSLLDLLNETDATITEGVPAELLKRKQENLDRQQDIADTLTGINISTEDLKKKPAELDAELEKLQTEYEEIENQIRTASPRYATLTANKPLALAEVQQSVLDDQTVLVEYALQMEESYLFAISKGSVNIFKLPGRATIEKLAMDLRAQLIPSKLQRRIVGIDVAEANRGLGIASAAPEDAAPFVAASNALYKVVLEPAAGTVGEKRLMVVADGALNYIPFEVLLKTSDSGDFSSLGYLVKSNEVVYAPSASVVGAIRQQRTRTDSRAMLIIADPVFNSNDARAHKPAAAPAADAEVRGLGIQAAIADVGGAPVPATPNAQMEGLPLARLNGTRTEADQISKLAKASGGSADVWLDLDANEDNLGARDISKYRIIHVATHGLLNAERPQFTGVVLSLVGNKTHDGFVRTDEVFNLRLGSPLVMLSACETGLGKEKRGEGVMGLTRAFMYAGAPTVGVSLWSVADKSTADLMTDFYRRLLTPGQGTTSSGALRGAQLAMISGKKYSAPFYWAPFVLVGDWN